MLGIFLFKEDALGSASLGLLSYKYVRRHVAEIVSELAGSTTSV